MAVDLAALKSELTNDPAAIGYTGDDAGDADLINTPDPARPQWQTVDSADFVGSTDPDEWSSLTQKEKDRYQVITSAGTVDARYPNVRSAFASMFAANSVTRPALLALAQRDGSRAEELFGENVRVTPSQIADARRL